MKTVLKHVFARKRAFGRQPLFDWMRDSRIDAHDRVAFYPAMAHFILSFGDINKYVLRYDAPSGAHEEMINIHTQEDDHHWLWYLEDLSKLGFDDAAPGSCWMRFLWGEETTKSRLLMYRLVAIIESATVLERLAVIEAIEEAGNVFFEELLPVAQQLEQRLGVSLRYCGAHHLDRESGHAMGSDHRDLAAVELSPAERARCIERVDRVFDLFSEWMAEMYGYARAHGTPDSRRPIQLSQPAPESVRVVA